MLNALDWRPMVMKAAGLCMLAGLACSSPARSADRAEVIPFRLEGHNIVVDVGLSAGVHLPFAFDSGLAPGHIIVPRAALRAGIKPDRAMGVFDASGQRTGANLSRIPVMHFAGLTLRDQLVAITAVPKKVLQRPGREDLAGYLGAPLLDGAVLCVDYSTKELKYWRAAQFQPAGSQVVPLQVVHGLPTIKVQIDGREATLIVDTGADSALSIYAAFAMRNDFPNRYGIESVESGNGGSGHDFDAIATQARDVELGPGAEFQNVPMQVIPQGMDPSWGIDGVIGFQMLSQLDPCIDEAGSRLMYRGE